MNSLRNSATVQALAQWAIAAAGLGFAAFLGGMIAEGNYQAIALLAAVSVSLVFYFGFSSFLWMLCVCSIFIPGRLTFIPLGMKLFEVLLIAGTIHFFLEKTVFKKIYPRIGPQPVGSWLLLFLAIVLFHGFTDRFGVRLLGSDTWGGRAYLSIVISSIAYFCIQATPFSLAKWAKLPILVILIASVDFIIKVVSYNVPAFEMAISAFYSGTISSTTFAEFSRLGFLGNFGYVLVATALSLSTLPGMITRGKAIPPLLLLVGIALCLSSGYRSSLLFLFCLLLMGSVRDLGFKTLFFVPILITSLLAVSWINSNVAALPQGVQRGLVWIPGEWDENLTLDAAGSDDFRWKVWTFWAQHKFPEAPLIGRGLGVPNHEIMANLEEAQAIDPSTGQTIMAFADRDRSFTITGNLHNGFLSVIDRFGLVGAFCFFTFITLSFVSIIQVLLRTPVKYETCSIHWLGVYICASILAYPIGALRIDDFFAPTVFLIAIFYVLAASYDRAKRNQLANPPAHRAVQAKPAARIPAPAVASL